MSNTCYDPSELETIAALPADAAECTHLADCARCRVLLAEYRCFLAGGRELAETEDREVGAQLADELTARIAAGATAVGPLSSVSAVPGRRFLPYTLTVGLAVAAVLVLTIGLDQLQLESVSPTPDINLRAAPSDGAAKLLKVSPVEVLAADRLGLAWQSYGANVSYRIVVYSAQLREVASFDVGVVTEYKIDLTTVPVAVGQRSGLLWRVIVEQSGDEIGRSGLLPLLGS